MLCSDGKGQQGPGPTALSSWCPELARGQRGLPMGVAGWVLSREWDSPRSDSAQCQTQPSDRQGPRSSWQVKTAGQGQGPALDQWPMAQDSLGSQAPGTVAPSRTKLKCRSHRAERDTCHGFSAALYWLGVSSHISSRQGDVHPQLHHL